MSNPFPNIRPLHHLASLYMLDVDKVAKLNRMGRKSAERLIANIEASKYTSTFAKFIFGLGIRHVGQVAADILAKRYTHIDDLVMASYDDLVALDGIGPKIAESVVQVFKTYQYDIIVKVEVGL